MDRFEIKPQGPYSFAESVRFLEGFAPAAYEGSGEDELRLAFVVDGGEGVAGVLVGAEGKVVTGEVHGDVDTDIVRRQVARILSLDLDAEGFAGVGDRDPVVRRLQRRYPGLRPVLFYSPYEAAVWAIIGNRIRIVQAAKVKRNMAEQLGSAIEIDGETEFAFPAPSRLVDLEGFPGLYERKVDYLRHLGHAAAEGKLDTQYLRTIPVAEALDELKQLPGIGDFSAELILLRGAGEPDYLPESEPRLARAVEMAYGLDEPPSTAELRDLSETWRPYRSWVGLYLRTMLEDETGEISGRPSRIGTGS